MSSEESFFHLVRTLCYATRFLGVNGFAFPSKRGVGMKLYNNRMSIAAVVVPTVVMFSVDIIRIIVSKTGPTTSDELDAFDVVKLMTLIVLGRVQALTNILSDVKNRSRIWTIISGLCDFDIVIRRICGHVKFNKLDILMQFIVSTFILSVALAVFEVYVFVRTDYFGPLLQAWCNLVYRTNIFANILMLMFYTYHIQMRYKILNENLRFSFRIPQIDGSLDSSLLSAEIADRPKTIQLDLLVRNTARLHLKLSDIVDHINYCYSFQFLQFCLKVFLFVLASFYDVYLYFLSRRTTNKAGGAYTMYMLMYAVYYTYFLFIIALYGSLINRESRKTAFIVNRAMDKSQKNTVVLAELKQFLQQLEHTDPHLSCGLFYIELNLILEGAAAVIAYVATLIQYDAVSYSIDKKEILSSNLARNRTV